jgi:DNA-binding transcriptional MerR regulator
MANLTYGTPYICALFGVSRQTVANWCERYAPFLDDGANPPKGRHREYTEKDLPVLAQIAQMSSTRRSPKEIEQALADGARAPIPEISDRAITERTEGTRQFVLMEAALAKAEVKRAEAEAKADGLQIVNNEQAGQIKLLKAQLDEYKTEIRQLYQEIADLKAGAGDE